MDYNEDLVAHIKRFESAMDRAGLPGEMAMKVGSLMGCLEYQVEEGDWPDGVVVSLQAAVRAWLETTPRGKDLIPNLDECIKSITRDV